MNTSRLTQEKILSTIEMVVEKLMHLGEVDNDADKNTGSDAHKKGIIARDFGIMEWDWPQGVGLYGLSDLQKQLGEDRYDDFLKHWFHSNISYGLPSKNINTTAPYLALLDYSRRKGINELEAMALDRANWIMDSLPRTKEGGFQHVTSAIGDRNDIALNDSEMWLDTLFMAVLFLNKMGHIYDVTKWRSEATKQFLMHIKYLFNKEHGLFYHGWSFNRNDNFGGIFWCRGNSWFTFGVLEFLEDAAETLDPGVRSVIEDTFRAQALRLKELQSPGGLWHTVLDDASSYTEVSGSAAIAKGLLKGYRMGLLDTSYKTCALRAIEAICENVEDDGTVSSVSAGTGMGMDVDHYKNIILAPMAYGQSLTLVALTEALAAIS